MVYVRQFIIHIGSEAREVEFLAYIGKTLGEAGINIVSGCGTTAFGVCTAILLVSPQDEERAIELLREKSIPFGVQDVLIASLPNKPGAFGNFSQLLGDRGIQIQSFYGLRVSPNNRSEFAISVNEADFERAKAFLDASGFLKTFNGA